jgi:glucan phosphoethanolaminetransferase (alkaline phosphatase superfamily)
MFALLGGRLWLGCVILAPFAMLAPLEDFYVISYLHPSTVQVLASVFATDLGETIEYFGHGIVLLAVCMLGGLILALATGYLCGSADLRWQHRSRVLAQVIALLMPLVGTLAYVARAQGDISARLNAVTIAASGLRLHITWGFPFGVITRLCDYYEEWRAMTASVTQLSSFKFQATRTLAMPQRQVYVLVLGESSRRNHWQLFGYERETNPSLSQLRNLVPIPDMLTSWPESVHAIPVALTRKPITDVQLSWNEPSILRGMEEAGIETWWISNQMPLGKFDSPVSVYAREAQHMVFLNHSSFSGGGSYDDALIAPLRNALSRNTSDLFIVLHMMGSHLRYDARYPAEFKGFKPTITDPEESDDSVRNSYDNTVLYTDYVLAQVIRVLDESNLIGALLFESDHGETLPTERCFIAGHGIGSRYDFQVPAFLWYSNAYAAAFPERIAAFRANATNRTLSASTFESLIDMAGVIFPGHDESWSLFSNEWRYRPRIVNAPLAQLDFDKAEFVRGCEVVAAPGNIQKRAN